MCLVADIGQLGENGVLHLLGAGTDDCPKSRAGGGGI